jgi:hypothetical protein
VHIIPPVEEDDEDEDEDEDGPAPPPPCDDVLVAGAPPVDAFDVLCPEPPEPPALVSPDDDEVRRLSSGAAISEQPARKTEAAIPM